MGFARACGTTVQHIKPHGALYNMAANDDMLSRAIVDALAALDERLILFGLPGSGLLETARHAGLRVAREVFADRAYHEDGTLVSRQQAGAVITDSTVVAERVLKMVKTHTVTAVTGVEIDLEFETICVHGDTVSALEHVQRITRALTQEGVTIAPVSTFL